MRKPATNYIFPTYCTQDRFDAVMCEDDGDIYMEEVGTGEVWKLADGELHDFFTEMPLGWTVGILMPDGSVGKIIPNRGN